MVLINSVTGVMNIADKIRKFSNVSTVFTISDIKTILGTQDNKSIYNALFYAVKKNELYNISDGVYSFNKEYSKKEFGNKFRTPSYVSLYTVLKEDGVVFQPYSSVFLISNRSEKINIDDQEYVYRKIQDSILLNLMGIYEKDGVNIATKERALCDKLYLDGIEYFDNVKDIDWKLLKSLNETVYSNNSVISEFISTYTETE